MSSKAQGARVSDAPKLPEFKNPPINEVVLGLQFDKLAGLTSAHFGLFWAGVRSKYARVTEQATLEPAFELFGSPSFRPLAGSAKIETFLSPPVPRYWFEADAEANDLLQLQQDRLLHNWRRKKPDDVYPRYGYVKSQLEADFADFEAFVRAEKLGEIEINQCEATYINLVQLESLDGHNDAARVLSIANAWPAGNGLPDMEGTIIQSRGVIQHDGKPVARMYVVLQPVMNMLTNTPAIRLEITVRGRPEGTNLPAALALCDIAHESIVNTFAAITTRGMQEDWGRFDGR